MSNIGRLIHGYCDGAFGRDFWGPARIEAEGFDWIVVRSAEEYNAKRDGTFHHHWFHPDGKQADIDKWASAED